jgi:type IV pilus assembly protein PilE
MPRIKGFTLIEVMVVVAIIAILAAVALPAYTDYVRRGKLSEGTSALLAMKTKMEQYFADNRSYTTPGAPVIDACVANSSVPKPALQYFTIDCDTPARTATTFTITANGIAATEVGGVAFTINQAGARTTAITSGSNMDKAGYKPNANCWTMRKGGTC